MQASLVVAAKATDQFLRRGKVIYFSSLAFIPLLNEIGVFRCWSSLFLSLSWVILRLVTTPISHLG